MRHIIDINTTCYHNLLSLFYMANSFKNIRGLNIWCIFCLFNHCLPEWWEFLKLGHSLWLMHSWSIIYVLSYKHITHKLFQWQSVNIPAQIRCKACAFLAMTLTQVWPWLATTSTTRFSVRPSMEKGDRICTTPGAL